MLVFRSRVKGEVMIKLPDDFSEIRIQKAKLWIERVMLDKPGMKEAKTCAAILEFITEVQRLNATAQPVSDGWVKCSERMPEIPYQQDQFIVYTDSMIVMAAWFNRLRGIFKDEHNGCVIDDVTHWMPLPAAPGGQDEQ